MVLTGDDFDIIRNFPEVISSRDRSLRPVRRFAAKIKTDPGQLGLTPCPDFLAVKGLRFQKDRLSRF